MRPHLPPLLAGGLLSLLTAASGLVLPLVVRELIGSLGSHRSLLGLLGLMIALVIVNAGLGAASGYLLSRTAESVVLAARSRLIDRLLGLTISALDRAEPGDLISRLTADTTMLRDFTTGAVAGVVTGSVVLVATLAMMAVLDVVLLGITLGMFIVAGLVVGLLVPRVGRSARIAQDYVGVMAAGMERVLGGFRTVKASGAERTQGQHMHAAARQAWGANVRAARWNAVADNIGGLAIQAAFVTVLAAGGARVASGAISVATLVAFLLYLYFLLPPIQQLVGAAGDYQIGAAALARISAAERLPVESVAELANGHGGSPDCPATIAFEQVRFRYRPELPETHCGISFSVPARGITAFVGLSGAGKTSIFSLLERFYEPDSGRILVDGKDIRDWLIPDLRAAIGYVEQDAPILSGSLRENLLLGAPGATDDDIVGTLRITRLSTLVARLPDGLETAVGHRGARLSGGERQRVAIARALLRRPRLLLLDEVTSQLDARNEAALRETVAETALITTVLIVAHRLSTVTMADRIIVMDSGNIKAIGTHRELVASNSLYAELATTQFVSAAER
ncbi:MAG TPA: ABC transporter ATP-binding protein [Streptosporangiaceae bacterium]